MLLNLCREEYGTRVAVENQTQDVAEDGYGVQNLLLTNTPSKGFLVPSYIRPPLVFLLLQLE
jgi:hypothetical protein